MFQRTGSKRRAVEGRWSLRAKGEAAFELGAYDPGQEVVIDPRLAYSTYLGGSDYDAGVGVAVDGLGSAYVTGTTLSTDFPMLNPLQTDRPLSDAFVTELSPSGDSLVYSTYLGGGSDDGRGIAVDGQGSAYVVGDTQSTDFPTLQPYQTDRPLEDAFVTKLALPPTALFTLPPCRLVDTRNARAISVNVAATASTAAGHLRLYPAGIAEPVTSSVNYVAGRSRSSNAVLTLSTSGAFTVRCVQASGTAHFILDVNGYFE